MCVELFHVFENIIQFSLFFQIPLLYIKVSDVNSSQSGEKQSAVISWEIFCGDFLQSYARDFGEGRSFQPI